MPSLFKHYYTRKIRVKLHQRVDKDGAAGSGITSDKDKAFSVPINWLATIDVVDKVIFESFAGLVEILNVGELFNVLFELSLHHQAVETDELDTIVTGGVV
jgi:hypothetical protein